jgi:hypothetical protein
LSRKSSIAAPVGNLSEKALLIDVVFSGRRSQPQTRQQHFAIAPHSSRSLGLTGTSTEGEFHFARRISCKEIAVVDVSRWLCLSR